MAVKAPSRGRSTASAAAAASSNGIGGVDGAKAVDAVRLWLESGAWTAEAYFALPETNHIVELSDGMLVVPDMPTLAHQRITGAFFLRLTAWNQQHQAGEVIVAPYPVRLWPGKVREPDVIFYLAEHLDRLGQQSG